MFIFHKISLTDILKTLLAALPFYALLFVLLEQLGIAEPTVSGLLLFSLGAILYRLYSLTHRTHYIVYALVLLVLSCYVS